jgi:CubicO group peptidase (beta-lactamase class C family)
MNSSGHLLPVTPRTVQRPAVPVGATATAMAATSSAPFADLDVYLGSALTPWGGGVLRLEQDGRVLLDHTYGGYRTVDAVPIGGATRLLSTIAILTLVKDGKLALDAPVGSVLPGWPKDKAAITLRMLLANTSGLPARSPCLEHREMTLAACVQEIAAAPLRAPVGTAFIDGGTGFQVAGRMAEVVAGTDWAQLFETRVMVPLGLHDTGFGKTDNPRISGGAQASGEGYARVLRQLLPAPSPDLLGDALRAEVLADQTRELPLRQSPYSASPGREGMRAGLGVYRERVGPDGHALEVIAQGVFGFTGWVDTERRLVGVLVVKGKGEEVWPVEQKARAMVRAVVPVPPR